MTITTDGEFEYGLDPDALDESLIQAHPIESVLKATQPVTYRLDLLRASSLCKESHAAAAKIARAIDEAGFPGFDNEPETLELLSARDDASWERVVQKFVARHLLPLFVRDIQRLEHQLKRDGVLAALQAARRQVRGEPVEVAGIPSLSYCEALLRLAVEQVEAVFGAVDPDAAWLRLVDDRPIELTADAVQTKWETVRTALMTLPQIDVQQLELRILEECRRAWPVLDGLRGRLNADANEQPMGEPERGETILRQALESHEINPAIAESLSPEQRRNIILHWWNTSEKLTPAKARDRWYSYRLKPSHL